MSKPLNEESSGKETWRFAIAVSRLKEKGILVVRIEGHQIALFDTPKGLRACDNRCPHEGYPLSEGDLNHECILTCNWHNWKFDLDNGDNLFGGDRLRTYPLEIRGKEIWLDVAEPPFADRYAAVVRNLQEAFDDHAYDRLAREIARLVKIGADPLDAMRQAIAWSWQKMEFGWTHAYAGLADWLLLFNEHGKDQHLQLVCLLEGVAHTAYDVLREKTYPYDEAVRSFNETDFQQAIENEEEARATAMIRGGLRDGLGFADFERALTHAALAHYNDFGHSLIYLTKAGYLIDKLGSEVAAPLLLSLVRNLIYARREDKIPEFRAYAVALADWGQGDADSPEAGMWWRQGIHRSLEATVKVSKAAPEDIYLALLETNSRNLLNYDSAQQEKVKVSVSGNISWLDFTHGLTFANAVRKQCQRFPQFWPQGLLQMACFSGRNAAYVTVEDDSEQWKIADINLGVQQMIEGLFDHGHGEYIVSVHCLKTALAVREEIPRAPATTAELLAAALNRFIHSPLKRRHSRRTAYQSLQFVAKE